MQTVALGGFLKGPTPEAVQATEKLIQDLGLTMGARGRPDLSNASDEVAQKYREGTQEIRDKYPQPTVTDMVDHIDHAVKIAGVDHVGLGADMYPRTPSPVGIRGAHDYPNITKGLKERGYSDKDVKKIMGGNFLRVWKTVTNK